MTTTRIALVLCVVQIAVAQQYPRYAYGAPYPYANYPNYYPYQPRQPFPGANPYARPYPVASPYPFQGHGYPGYPYAPKVFPQVPNSRIPTEIIDLPYVPDSKLNNQDYNSIPTDIIDVDENLIVPEITTKRMRKENPVELPTTTEISPYISGSSIQYYSSNVNHTKGIHIFESKPIHTVIRKRITSNGRDGRNVINIHVVNGVEVTTTSDEGNFETTAAPNEKADEKASEEDEDVEEHIDDGSDPKPVDSWLFG